MNSITRNEETKRATVYDWLRLIATIYVVIGHSAYLNISTTYGGVAYNIPETVDNIYHSTLFVRYRYLTEWVYGFHMPLFFMLSGAVFALKPIDKFDNIVRSKTKRLLFPYYIYGCLFMFPVKRIGGFYDNTSLKEAIKGFFSGLDSGHLWFLPALFWCIIVFAVCRKILDRCKVKSIYGIMIICGIIQLLHFNLPFDVLQLKTGLNYLFFFSLGYIFECERNSNEKWTLKQTGIVCIITIIFEIINIKYGVLNTFFTIIIGSLMTYLVASICDKVFVNVMQKKVWNLIIRNLFYVYIFHDPLEYIVLRLFFSTNWLESSFGCIAYYLCRTLVICGVSILLGETIRKISCGLKRLNQQIKV